jgi:hypothetical protein
MQDAIDIPSMVTYWRVCGNTNMSIQEKRVIDLLQAKRRKDPEGFREYLPDVAELLPEPPPRRSRARPTFGLTERELSYQRAGLLGALGKLDDGAITTEDAVKGLEHCAALIKDDNLPYSGELADGYEDPLGHEMGHEVLLALVRAALGKSPGSYKSKTTVHVGKDGAVLEQVSVIMGVLLDLDRNGRLVSLSIDPGKYRKRRKLMKFVGASMDPETDVAARHDYYLAMQDPHGRD